MTSKHLFFRVMKEDLRHRVWMMVMSALAGFLLPSVIWLLFQRNLSLNVDGRFYEDEVLARQMRGVLESMLLAVGGLVGSCGALTAALTGFRFMLHKDQVDTWHSMPVKRDVLFGTCYLNGVLIWLLPLFAGFVLVGVLAGRFLTGNGDLTLFASVLRVALKSFFICGAAFLLVYHLTLTAMMLSGNVLNTIVGMLILGVGVLCCYVLNVVLHERYLETYFVREIWAGADYASPLSAAWTLIAGSADNTVSSFQLCVYVLEAAALGVCAWILYRRRPSELSEQGISCRVYAGALRLVTTAAAGVGGWLFFDSVSNGSVVWAVFGAILALVLVHGILNVVFDMEFRAFFAHKAQLGCVAAAVLSVCFCFMGGWFGYDSYCPEKEEIAEIGLKVEGLTNRYYGVPDDALTAVKYRDKENAFALLKAVSQQSEGDGAGDIDIMWIRVTLENGRTYYRKYRVNEELTEVLMPIVTSREYLEGLYFLDDERMTEYEDVIRLQVEQDTVSFGTKKYTGEELRPLFQAYNQDFLEDPETILMGKGRILAGVVIGCSNQYGYSVDCNLEIYETMSRTVEALKQLGYEKQLTPKSAAEIAAIELKTGSWVNIDSPEEIIAAARKQYGVKAEGSGETSVNGNREAAEVQTVDEHRQEAVLFVTDSGEIEELLALISYNRDYRWIRGFARAMVSVEMTDKDGRRSKGYIRKGDLPEKYILRFGQLATG